MNKKLKIGMLVKITYRNERVYYGYIGKIEKEILWSKWVIDKRSVTKNYVYLPISENGHMSSISFSGIRHLEILSKPNSSIII